MELVHAVGIFAAGMAAGTINTVVGSGTLVTFPTLLAFGYPPVVANVSNSLGLVAGGVTGAWGYRRELRGAGDLLRRLLPWSFAGGVLGALLLILLPPEAFDAIVPALIFVGLLLVVLGPRLQRRAAAAHDSGRGESPARRVGLLVGVLAAGVYGGYFGAAQGVILMGLMSALLTNPLQQLNGIKNVLGMVVNGVAAVTFMVVAGDKVDWAVAGLIAMGAFLGGFIGAGIGRRLPPWLLRSVIVLIGLVAIVQLLRG